MRIQTDCCCGAVFTLDDSGRDDVCTRNQFDQRHAAWNALHKGCPALVPPPREVDARVRDMLVKMVDSWQSDMVSETRYDELAWDARMLLDETAGAPGAGETSSECESRKDSP